MVDETNAPAIAPEVPAGVKPDTKTETAKAIYTAWRNEFLGSLSVADFERVEAASGSLISEIAAKI